MTRFGLALLVSIVMLWPCPPTRGQPAGDAAAPAKPANPAAAVKPESCVTAECHAGVKQHKVLHGPVNVNACDGCHTLVDVKLHTYKLARKADELCVFCHKLETEGAKVVHKPLVDGQCMACHDAHGGFDGNFLKSKSMNELCKTCHKDVVGDRKFTHGPVAAGACGVCHFPHASERPKLLAAEGRDLCLICHAELADQIDKVKFAHQPAKENCQECHDAHASNYPMMIRSEPIDLCTRCHEDVKHAVTEAKHQHSAVTKGRACLNCHTGHGSDLASLVKDTPINLCLACHDKKITTSKDQVIASVAEIADDKLVKHGPLRKGTCGGCHNVHGSDVSRLLTKPYPPTFYAKFKAEDYELCFSCHNKELAMQANTKQLTGFRNGDVNMHFVHVNKDKHRHTCRACHSTHASKQAVHIRDSVPYGNWELPINYEKTKTGGSCIPGCHKPLAYDRDNPVPAEAPKEPANASPAATESGNP